jgi:hypothetical protein
MSGRISAAADACCGTVPCSCQASEKGESKEPSGAASEIGLDLFKTRRPASAQHAGSQRARDLHRASEPVRVARNLWSMKLIVGYPPCGGTDLSGRKILTQCS